MKSALPVLLALLAVAGAPTATQPVADGSDVRLVLLIAVDQLRYDYLTRFRGEFTGGFRRLVDEGAVFTDANLEHYPTVTAVGHSTMLSGATPSVSGILGNDWFDRDLGRSVARGWCSFSCRCGFVGRCRGCASINSCTSVGKC